ncbi:MAG: ImmA/IrrE family metallo-endopeptidase [Hydrogenophaga sp.]|uniref:ImmA/IrrE family metallo-endopeptidase n=1 Tax=Hydrogenophaga sp. TaxID=1904254 RepID=UPI00257B337C|nr:ImmA/IrrE family metallo-endopeptidase [Hydrogenophaga sp.]MBL0943934.1 ImmA/IrrE family metallo-endopeptidase [Hydrogenophaga sp.]
MDKQSIEKAARSIQFEIYSNRDLLFPMGVPPVLSMFEPRFVAEYYGLSFELRSRLPAENTEDFEAAGLLDRRRNTIVISTAFSQAHQRFTAGHELGHYVLHGQLGLATAHRDRPLNGSPQRYRSPLEAEADHFAACLLMPRRAVEKAFVERFGTKVPLALTEAVAFHLGVVNINPLFSAQAGTAAFALVVANARRFVGRQFSGSLAEHFGVSPSAMAYRLQELQLIAEYLHSD